MSTVWHLVYTKPNKENLAKQHLQRQGYSVYLPMTQRVKRLRGRRSVIDEPLFPRYLFIKLNLHDQDWSPIRSTIGVSHLVRFGVVPARVPESFVEFCQRQEQGQRELSQDRNYFDAGDSVRIVSGSFAGYEAVFECAKSDERAVVLLNIANSFTQLQVDQGDLDKVA